MVAHLMCFVAAIVLPRAPQCDLAAGAETKRPPSIRISAAPRTIFVGQPFKLTWFTTSVTDCRAYGAWTGPKALSGTQTTTSSISGKLTYSLICIGSSGEVSAQTNVSVENASLSLTETFLPNSLTISTSEGAPSGFCDFWVQKASHCTNESNYGYGPTKVLHVYVCLSGRVSVAACSKQRKITGPLPPEMLREISSRIGGYSGSGVRLIVRFTYNFGPIGSDAMDAPIDVITNHIDQLAPILLDHKDLIVALEAGFIGAWGEWHHSTNGNDNGDIHSRVLNKELSYFRNVFPILVRYPGDSIQFTANAVPPSEFGIHDDYYASDSVDGGTWRACFMSAGYCLSHYSSRQLRKYAERISAKSLFIGEFGALDETLQSCDNLDRYSYKYHVQSIHLFPFPATIGANLQDEGCATSFYNRVGTRIVLLKTRIIGKAIAGGKLFVEATMVNEGYGRVIRRRPVTLILTQNAVAVAKIKIQTGNLDLRTLNSSSKPLSSTFQFIFNLPKALSSGPTSMALLFHDPAPSLFSRPAYALPLNSVDQHGRAIFDPATGYNLVAQFNIN